MPEVNPLRSCDNLIEWDALFTLVQVTQIGGEGGTLQVFHHNIGVAIGGIKIKNLDDVSMA